jgi:hypothetical protein
MANTLSLKDRHRRVLTCLVLTGIVLIVACLFPYVRALAVVAAFIIGLFAADDNEIIATPGATHSDDNDEDLF